MFEGFSFCQVDVHVPASLIKISSKFPSYKWYWLSMHTVSIPSIFGKMRFCPALLVNTVWHHALGVYWIKKCLLAYFCSTKEIAVVLQCIVTDSEYCHFMISLLINTWCWSRDLPPTRSHKRCALNHDMKHMQGSI